MGARCPDCVAASLGMRTWSFVGQITGVTDRSSAAEPALCSETECHAHPRKSGEIRAANVRPALSARRRVMLLSPDLTSRQARGTPGSCTSHCRSGPESHGPFWDRDRRSPSISENAGEPVRSCARSDYVFTNGMDARSTHVRRAFPILSSGRRIPFRCQPPVCESPARRALSTSATLNPPRPPPSW